MTLRRGDRDGVHGLDVVDRHVGLGQQAVLDIEHDLAVDAQLVVERQRILREVDGSFDRVLDGDEAEVDVAALDRVEHIGHGAVRHQLAVGQIGLGAQRLLGEGSERAEESDPRHGA